MAADAIAAEAGRYDACSADELTVAFTQLEAVARATLAEQLAVVGAYDDGGHRKADGVTSKPPGWWHAPGCWRPTPKTWSGWRPGCAATP